MDQQRGFSLVEMLASLLLVTTLALSLLQQQGQNRQLLHQLILREQGAQFLDQMDETNTWMTHEKTIRNQLSRSAG